MQLRNRYNMQKLECLSRRKEKGGALCCRREFEIPCDPVYLLTPEEVHTLPGGLYLYRGFFCMHGHAKVIENHLLMDKKYFITQ